MKKSKSGFTLVELMVVIQLAILLSVGLTWIVNAVKFAKSDFEAPYKREVIHGAGLIPGISIVTCWLNFPEK